MCHQLCLKKKLSKKILFFPSCFSSQIIVTKNYPSSLLGAYLDLDKAVEDHGGHFGEVANCHWQFQ